MAKYNETDLLRMAKAGLGQLAHEFKDAVPTSTLPNASGAIATPNRRQLEIYSDGQVKTCGNCKHFDLEAGRKKMIEERFLERLVAEQEWKLRHLGAKVDELGLCGESNGTMVVSFMAIGCDHHTARR